jgi:hypothetical protein
MSFLCNYSLHFLFCDKLLREWKVSINKFEYIFVSKKIYAKKNTQTLIDTSKDIGVEVNTENSSPKCRAKS